MEARHDDSDLERLEFEQGTKSKFGPDIVRAFRKVMALIRAAPNETEFRKFRSLNFEKLKGSRKHQWSMRLNDQFRLIVEIVERKGGNYILVKGIEDYH